MHIESYKVEIPPFLDKLQGLIAVPLEESAEGIAKTLAVFYRAAIELKGGVRTGFMRDIVEARKEHSGPGQHTWLVSSEAFYSGVFEFGWTERPRQQLSYPGRFAAALALRELTDEVVHDQIGRQLNKVLELSKI